MEVYQSQFLIMGKSRRQEENQKKPEKFNSKGLCYDAAAEYYSKLEKTFFFPSPKSPFTLCFWKFGAIRLQMNVYFMIQFFCCSKMCISWFTYMYI